MARLSWLPIAFFLILAMSFVIHTANATHDKEGTLHPEDCPKACEFRCSETLRKKPCLFACSYCCTSCLCVPSGTSGHWEECACYSNIKTKDGQRKCP